MRLSRLCDLRSPRQTRRRKIRRPHHDHLEFYFWWIDSRTASTLSSLALRSRRSLARRSLASLGLPLLRRALLLRARLSRLLLASPLPRSLRNQFFLLLAPHHRIRPRHHFPR